MAWDRSCDLGIALSGLPCLIIVDTLRAPELVTDDYLRQVRFEIATAAPVLGNQRDMPCTATLDTVASMLVEQRKADFQCASSCVGC